MNGLEICAIIIVSTICGCVILAFLTECISMTLDSSEYGIVTKFLSFLEDRRNNKQDKDK